MTLIRPTAAPDQYMTERELKGIVEACAFRAWSPGRFRPLEDFQAEAWFAAGRALAEFDGRGYVRGYVYQSVYQSLLDFAKKEARRLTRPIPPLTPCPQGWDCWCRDFMGGLGDDARAVVLAAMETPGEVFAALAGAGWSGPRIRAAVNEVREALR